MEKYYLYQMEIKDYSNERLKNTIHQSYHFSKEEVLAAKMEAVKRGIITTHEADKIIAKNLKIEEDKAEENYKNMQAIHMNNMGKTSFWGNIGAVTLLLSILISCVLYYKYQAIFWYILLPGTGFFAATNRRRIFNKRRFEK